ncbi:hypothetical protein Pyrfu_1647 [Pyrolobus fumarii 1A]|uniref:AAA ATPase n=1 Tax=Pyrolobus fumarii (strain DSM 11204 / 1A) TaxID=694429 RepID=G0ECD3_PYRF1|nr:hypothetical protein [Pyrolobus fumarii]AEM39503.1 hypothetical protein Pyrfu_1647 [Pyrolobus fumarii 1A]
MIDPALVFLLVGVASAVVQAARSVWGGRSTAKLAALSGLKVNHEYIKLGDKCYTVVLVEDLVCVFEAGELFAKSLELIISSQEVAGVIVAKHSVDRSSALANLENSIMSLRVVLEREPGNKNVERKLRILERMYESIMTGYQPVKAVIGIVVRGECRRSLYREAERIAREITKLGCKAKVMTGQEALKALLLPLSYSGSRKITTSRQVVTSLYGALSNTLSSTREGIYLGRRNDGVAFLLPLWSSSGSLHYVIVGPTGRGKTTLEAILAVRADAMGINVYSVDPKGDLANYLSGFLRIVKLTIREVFESMLWLYREGVIDKRVVSEALAELNLDTIIDAAITAAEECKPLYRLVDGHLLSRLKRLGLSNVTCRRPSWVSSGVVYDVSGLPEALKSIGAIVVSLSALSRRSRGLLLIDEAWRIGKLASLHVIRLYKEARSAGLSIVSATQDPDDLPQEIYNNSYGVILFGSNDEEYITRVVKRLGLSSEDGRKLRMLGVGEVLVRLAGSRPELVEIDASEILGMKGLKAGS